MFGSWEDLHRREMVDGVIMHVDPEGILVNVGGLIHTSELSWKSVTDPEEIVHGGDEFDVMVLNIAKEMRSFFLSFTEAQYGAMDCNHRSVCHRVDSNWYNYSVDNVRCICSD